MAPASTQPTRSAQGNRRGTMRRGAVVTYALGAAGDRDSHEARTRTGIATKLAELKGFEFAGEYDRGTRYGGSVVFRAKRRAGGHRSGGGARHPRRGRSVRRRGPSCLRGDKGDHASAVRRAGARSRGLGPGVPASGGRRGARRIRAFEPEDALRAGASLLERGPVRVKRATGIGGRGQYVVKGTDDLAEVLGAIDADELSTSGVVIEENLDEVTTYSVGQVRVGRSRRHLLRHAAADDATTGAQKSTAAPTCSSCEATSTRCCASRWRNPSGSRSRRPASTTPLPTRASPGSSLRGAITTWCRGSMRADGSARGVLEQSWRIGGASGAEIGALEAFRADPGAEGGARRFRRGLRRKPAAARGCGRVLSRRRRACRPAHQIQPGRAPCRRTTNSLTSPSATQHIAGTLVAPRTLIPGVLFVHGWGGSQQQYVARARTLAALGCVCLTFDLRGHVQTLSQHETVSREDNLRDVFAAYDVLAAHPKRRHDANGGRRQQLWRLPCRDPDVVATGASGSRFARRRYTRTRDWELAKRQLKTSRTSTRIDDSPFVPRKAGRCVRAPPSPATC